MRIVEMQAHGETPGVTISLVSANILLRATPTELLLIPGTT